jgi:hypothetical protein
MSSDIGDICGIPASFFAPHHSIARTLHLLIQHLPSQSTCLPLPSFSFLDSDFGWLLLYPNDSVSTRLQPCSHDKRFRVFGQLFPGLRHLFVPLLHPTASMPQTDLLLWPTSFLKRQRSSMRVKRSFGKSCRQSRGERSKLSVSYSIHTMQFHLCTVQI